MIDTTTSKFKEDVIDASMQVPVLVDFWAPWCAPCKTLGPMLEKLEQAYGGRFKLVKVDTDKEQQLAQHFKIRSIPTVFAIVGGRPVDQFQGALPEAKLREFIDRLMPNPADIEMDLAMAALERNDVPTAVGHIKKTIALDPSHDEARIVYAQLLMQDNELPAANEQLQAISAAAKQDPQTQGLIEQVARLMAENRVPPAPELEARVAANGQDLQARLELAQHYMAHKAWEEALTQLIEIVRTDRKFGEDIGRKTMLEIFDKAAAQPQLVSGWRRKLSSVLF